MRYSGDNTNPYSSKNLPLNGSRILFFGPGVKQQEPEIKEYDYVIITNNQVNLFFEKYESISCKVILLSNYIFSRNYYHCIAEKSEKIFCILVVNQESLMILKTHIPSATIFLLNNIPEISNTPLGLIRIVALLKKFKFELFHIIGVDFYMKSTVETSYEPNYLIKELSDNHSALDNVHNLEENIIYFLRFYFSRANRIIIDASVLAYIMDINRNDKQYRISRLRLWMWNFLSYFKR